MAYCSRGRSGHAHFSAYDTTKGLGNEGTDSNWLCGTETVTAAPGSADAYARKHRQHLWCNKRLRQLAPDEVLGMGARDRAFS